MALNYLRSNKFLYSIVVLQALVVALAALGFLPRVATLFSTMVLMLYMAFLPPLLALRFFVLSLPWLVALPLGRYDKFQSWRILIVEVFVIAILYNGRDFAKAWAAGRAALAKFFKLTKLDWVYLIFLAVSVLLLLINPGFLKPGLKAAITYLNLYGIFFTAKFISRTAEDRQVLTKALALSGLTVVAVGFLQLAFFLRTNYYFFWQYWTNTVIPIIFGGEYARVSVDSNTWFSYSFDNPPGLRMFSLMPGSQVFAMISVFTLALCLTVREFVQNRKRLWLVFGCLAGLAAVLTSVRASMVGALFALCVLLALYFVKKLDRQNLKKGALPVAIFIGWLLFSPLVQLGLNELSVVKRDDLSLLERSATLTQLGYESNKARLIIWRTSLAAAAKYPLFGVGLGNFALIFDEAKGAKNFEEIIQEKEAFVNLARKHISAHNILLQVLVESGLIGLALFVAFLWTVLREIYARFKTAASGTFPKNFALFFGLALVWILGHAMFDSVFLTDDEPLTFFWLALAVLLSEQE